MSGTRQQLPIIVVEKRDPGMDDVRDEVAALVDRFCERFGISGRDARSWVYLAVEAQANAMGAELKRGMA